MLVAGIVTVLLIRPGRPRYCSFVIGDEDQ